MPCPPAAAIAPGPRPRAQQAAFERMRTVGCCLCRTSDRMPRAPMISVGAPAFRGVACDRVRKSRRPDLPQAFGRCRRPSGDIPLFPCPGSERRNPLAPLVPARAKGHSAQSTAHRLRIPRRRHQRRGLPEMVLSLSSCPGPGRSRLCMPTHDSVECMPREMRRFDLPILHQSSPPKDNASAHQTFAQRLLRPGSLGKSPVPRHFGRERSGSCLLTSTAPPRDPAEAATRGRPAGSHCACQGAEPRRRSRPLVWTRVRRIQGADRHARLHQPRA